MQGAFQAGARRFFAVVAEVLNQEAVSQCFHLRVFFMLRSELLSLLAADAVRLLVFDRFWR